MTPERQYEKSWALGLLDRVMQRLRAEYERRTGFHSTRRCNRLCRGRRDGRVTRG